MFSQLTVYFAELSCAVFAIQLLIKRKIQQALRHFLKPKILPVPPLS
jgi:hypothetical protein